MLKPIGRRIVVVGPSGCGKTTLARALSARLGIPALELDALQWGPHWTPAEPEVFRANVDAATSGDTWIVDGNYSVIRDLVWSRAETVIWLDYSVPRMLWQLTRRTSRRMITREELWAGNRESLREALFSRDSLFLWALQKHPEYRVLYPEMLRRPEFAHLHVIRLRTPRETRTFLAGLSAVESGTWNP
jgi:adenylate kinase family enzyme